MIRATEGFTPGLRGERRTLLPMNSSLVVTEPLPAEVTVGKETNSSGQVSDSAKVFFRMALDESEPFRDAEFFAWDLANFANGTKKFFYGTYTSGFGWDDTYTEEVSAVQCH